MVSSAAPRHHSAWQLTAEPALSRNHSLRRLRLELGGRSDFQHLQVVGMFNFAVPDACWLMDARSRPEQHLANALVLEPHPASQHVNHLEVEVVPVPRPAPGEILVPMINLDRSEQRIEHGDRIAQLLLAEVVRIEWEEAAELPESGRGAGGFGSTGR